MTQESETVESWEKTFTKFLVNAFYGGLWFLAAGIISGLMQDNVVSKEIGYIFGIGAIIMAAYYGIKAVWFAFLSVFWPILLFLGVVGVSAAEKISEGGVKDIADKVWYGKKGPRD